MKLKSFLILILITGTLFAKDTKTYKVGTQAWLTKDQKLIDIPPGYPVTFTGYSCWVEERIHNFKYGVGIYCKPDQTNDIILVQAVCDKRSPGDEAYSNVMIIGKETVSLNAECRTTNKESI